MTELSDEIQRRVSEARASNEERQRKEVLRLAEQAKREADNKERAKSLFDEIQKELRQAAASSDGALTFHGPIMAGMGANACHLTWESPPPRRDLKIVVNHFDGYVTWGWAPQQEAGRKEALDFTIDGDLRALIMELTEDNRWH